MEKRNKVNTTDYSKPENRKTPVRSMRLKCLDCCGWNRAEVTKCEITTCPLWPYRNGRNPGYKERRKNITLSEKKKLTKQLAVARKKKSQE